MLEVELKARVVDAHLLLQRLGEHGFFKTHTRNERDTYYCGIDRDFAQTDEALRLRAVTDIESGRKTAAITFKGPKLDSRSQTRKEYETGVEDATATHAILQALGHQPVLTVCKTRTYYQLNDITACVDDVDGLGSYMELETLTREDENYSIAVNALLALLGALGIEKSELTRKSYLEMLLEKQRA